MGFIKIRFLHDTFIRSAADDLSAPPIGVLYAGTEVWVEDEPVRGEVIDGNDLWYRDFHGWYYWSGASEVILDADLPEELLDTLQEEENMPLLGWPIPWESLYFDPRTMNWGLNELEIPEFFWKKQELTGAGIKIAILDTGVDYQHPDLKGAIKGFRNFLPQDWGRNSDLDGNGTTCAGLICGRGAYKVFGAAPEAELFVGKIMQHPYQQRLDGLLEGLKWAAQLQVDIVYTSANLRPASLQDRQAAALRKAIEALVDQNILLVAPVGNSLQPLPEDRLPASLPVCLSVGAYGLDRQPLEISGRSPHLDVLAPGERLLTAAPEGKTDYRGGTFAAAALTAGTCALLLQYFRREGMALSVLEVVQRVRQTAQHPFPQPKCQDAALGCGLFHPKGCL